MDQEKRRNEGREYVNSLHKNTPGIPKPQVQRRGTHQPYPDMGWTRIEPDYKPVIGGGVAVVVLLSCMVLGINAAIQSKNADSPANTPEPTPTVILDRIPLRSQQAYNQLIQGRNNPDNSLYRSFDVGSENPTVRIGPSTHAPAIGQLEAHTHIPVESTIDFGDNPNTLAEEAYDKPWQAMECDDIQPYLINPVTSTYPTRTNAMCFIYNPLIRPYRQQTNP